MRAIFKGNLILFVVCAGVLSLSIIYWSILMPPGNGRGDRPESVPIGCREIAWLAPPSSSLPWQRLVTAAQLCISKGAIPGCSLEDSNAFPTDSATIPEFRVQWKNKSLIWRWYREGEDSLVTEKLLQRNPPPLALVGGSNTDSAKQLAEVLVRAKTSHFLEKPVLMLTTATADFLNYPDGPETKQIKLLDIHQGLTFRAGFSNKHMAKVLIDFLKSQSVWTGPLPAPWIIKWEDDPYATDLKNAFYSSWQKLPDPHKATPEIPSGIDIKSSVGGLTRPNEDETAAASVFIERASKFTNLESNWLILCGQILPSRRLLKAMSRGTESRMQGLTVVAGDTLGFNTIYRDWQELWPSIDLPYRMVFFCHENPVDESAGFVREPSSANRHLATGTEDLLLNLDVIQALVEGWKLLADTEGPNEFASCLKQLKCNSTGPIWASGVDKLPNLFDCDGNRMPGTGEHLVTLSPSSPKKQPNGAGQIEVWSAYGDATPSRFKRIRQLSQPVYRR